MRQALTRETETLEFVHAMLGQLRRMVQQERHEVLAYMMEMACIEAEDILRQARRSPVGNDEGDSAA